MGWSYKNLGSFLQKKLLFWIFYDFFNCLLSKKKKKKKTPGQLSHAIRQHHAGQEEHQSCKRLCWHLKQRPRCKNPKWWCLFKGVVNVPKSIKMLDLQIVTVQFGV